MWAAAVLRRPGGRGVRRRCSHEDTQGTQGPHLERPHAQKRGPEAPERLPSGTCGSWRLAEPCSRPGRPGQEGLHRQLPPPPPPPSRPEELMQHREAEEAGAELSARVWGGAESHGEGNELGTELSGCGHWSTHKRQGLGHGWSQHAATAARAARARESLPVSPAPRWGVWRGRVEIFLKARGEPGLFSGQTATGCPSGSDM